MRILHAVLSEGFYGSERYCAELAVAQANQGHTVQIVTLGQSSDCTQAVRRAIGDTKNPPQLVAFPHQLPAFLHRPFAYALLARFRPQIVHTHLDPATRRIGRVAQRLGIGHVATLHLSFSAPEYGACDGLVCIADWQTKTLPADFAGKVARGAQLASGQCRRARSQTWIRRRSAPSAEPGKLTIGCLCLEASAAWFQKREWTC